MEKDITKLQQIKKVIDGYTLQKYGVWEILGEDPNCDMSGCRHQPSLGFYEGILKDVITIASMKTHFFTWGRGGDISLISINQVNEKQLKVIHLLEKKKKLEMTLEKVSKEIEEI